MVKIHTCRDIPAEFAKFLKDDGVAMIDGEFTGLDIPDHDRLSLIQICGKDSKEIYLIQPNKYCTTTQKKIEMIFQKNLYERKFIKTDHKQCFC